jgi:methyl-accepting chemotaxis protein
MKRQGNRRRIYLIDRGFQVWMISRIAAMSALIMVVSLLLLAVVYYEYGDVTVGLMQPAPFASSDGENMVVSAGHSLFRLLAPVLILCPLGAVFVTLVYGLFMSHRMAGPVHRMQKTLTLMAQGDLTDEIRLRKKDAFKPMAESINELSERWRKSIQELKALCSELAPITHDKVQRQHLGRLHEILESFNTEKAKQ